MPIIAADKIEFDIVLISKITYKTGEISTKLDTKNKIIRINGNTLQLSGKIKINSYTIVLLQEIIHNRIISNDGFLDFDKKNW